MFADACVAPQLETRVACLASAKCLTLAVVSWINREVEFVLLLVDVFQARHPPPTPGVFNTSRLQLLKGVQDPLAHPHAES